MKIDWGEIKGIVLATPFYEVKAYSPYITSLVYTINALNFYKIPWQYYEMPHGNSQQYQEYKWRFRHFQIIICHFIHQVWWK